MSDHITPLPEHVAVVMDGNGRWAKERGLPRLAGHHRGAKTARNIVEWASDLSVETLSLYTFSSENWRRPEDEVNGLMTLLATIIPRELPEMIEKGVCLKFVGDPSKLPSKVLKALQDSCEKTAHNNTIDVVLCLNYGGQQEILSGIQALVRELMESEDAAQAIQNITVESFRNYLWCSELPAVDLLIRTGGEKRISNFYLWDAAYAELFFSETLWPDFSKDDLKEAIVAFGKRERRFGKTSAQVVV